MVAAKYPLELGLGTKVNGLYHFLPKLGVVLCWPRESEVIDVDRQQQPCLGEELAARKLGDSLPSELANDSLKMFLPVGPGLRVAVKGVTSNTMGFDYCPFHDSGQSSGGK